MTVTKLTIEIDDGEPVVITAGSEEDRWKARLGRWLNEAASDRGESRAADYQVAPPNTRLQQKTILPNGNGSTYTLGGVVTRHEWSPGRRELTVGFRGGTHIVFSFVADQERVRVRDD